MTAITELSQSQDLDFCRELGQQLRVDSIRCSTKAGSGHPTSSMSAADLMAVLMARHLHYDWEDAHSDHNDHLIFSKGHASPLLYAMFHAAGVVSDQELLSFRNFGSKLQGHPTPVIPWVDVATGSLGQGFPIAVGVALAGKYLDKLPYHVWCLCGDSELAEGSIWEAMDKASHYGLTNLTAIWDINRLGQRGPTEYGWDTDIYRSRATAFGWRAVVIDGHDVNAIDDAVAMDGEVSNSTHAEEFAKAYPDRYFEMFIAEQQLVAAAVGMSVRGYRPFASTFATFFNRAYDFIRMAAISEANIRLCGSHAGVEIGQDGPSQMGLEDLAAMRAVQGSTVLYPADATAAAKLTQAMAETDGVVYMRTTRGAYPVLYEAGEAFKIGGSKTLRHSDHDQVTLIGAGVTLHNCLIAAEELAKDGINARVIDLYCAKPVDVETLGRAISETGRLVVAEDHYPE